MATKRREATRRIASALTKNFEPKQKTETGVVVGPGLVAIDGQLFNAADLGTQKGRIIAVTNIGSPGAALYVPARNSSGTGAAIAGGATGSGSAPSGGTGATPGAHYLDDHLGSLSWSRVNKAGSNLTDLQNYKHDIVGTAHTISGLTGRIVGAVSDNTLGLFFSGSDGRAGNIILRTDNAGKIIVTTAEATNITGDNITANTLVRTPRITATAGLIINPTTGLELAPGTDLELHPVGNIYFDSVMASDQTTEGDSNIYLNPITGLIDTISIQANEAYFDAVIAEARWAEAGAIELTRSVAPLARPFTIPAVGGYGTMYVGYLAGLPGYNPLGNDHLAKVAFFQDGGVNQQPCAWIGRTYAEDEGIATGGGDPLVIYDTTFSEYDPGGHGINLLHTGANNSMVEQESNAQIYADGANNVLRIETNLNNCHTHYDGSGAALLEDYSYVGKFKMLSASVGVGFTIYSNYPNSDAYYRIRRYDSAGKREFYVENHGSGWSMQNVTASTYDPADYLGQWQNFRIEVNGGASGTEIRARFWRDGVPEPSAWQIDTWDSNSFRSAGTFGLWYMQAGPNNLMFDNIHVETQGAYGGAVVNSSVTIANPTGTASGDELIALVTYPSTATVTAPAGWTQIQTKTTTVPAVRSTMYRRTWITGQPTTHTWSLSAPGALFASMVAVRYVRTTGTRYASSSIAGNNTTTLQPAALATKDNGLVLYFLARQDGIVGGPSSMPAGFVYAGTSYAPSSAYAHSFYYHQATADSASFVPTFGNMSSTGDWGWFAVCLYPEDGADTPFFVGAAWGAVTLADPQPGDVTAEEVAYTWTTLGSYRSDDGAMVNAVGKTAQIDARVQDYGAPAGDVYMLLTVLDKKGPPYIRLARHTGYNQVTNQLNSTIIAQFGQLAGLAIPGVDPIDEPGLMIQSRDGRRTLLTSEQMLLDDVDSTWLDDDGDPFLTIRKETGATIVTKPTVNWAYFDPSPERGYTFSDANGNHVAGLENEITEATVGIFPKKNQLTLWSRGLRGNGIYTVVRAENTSATYPGIVKLEAVGGGIEAGLWLRVENGEKRIDTDAAEISTGAIPMVLNGTDLVSLADGGLIIAPTYTAAQVSSGFYTSHSLIQAHKHVGGYGAWAVEDVGATDINLLPSSSPPSVDRRVAGKAVIFNRGDGSHAAWDFNCAHGATNSVPVGASTFTLGVSGTGRLYIRRSSGTQNFDVSITAIWL